MSKNITWHVAEAAVSIVERCRVVVILTPDTQHTSLLPHGHLRASSSSQDVTRQIKEKKIAATKLLV
jgi:hypothetical protein